MWVEGNVLQEHSRRWARFLDTGFHRVLGCGTQKEVAGSRDECGEDGGRFLTP